ncbi:hypothetical protein QQ045_015134 [Rhodiola kirilowii]
MHSVAHFIFGIFGNATALFLFVAPTITFKRIIRSKSTEQFSGIPYVMTLLNCLLSAWYGLPFVSPNNLLISTINGTGAGIEAIYVFIFLIYAPRKERLKILCMFTAVMVIFSTVVLVSLLALHGQSRKLFCGFAATIFSIIMYGSPLSIMRMVIKTKSVEFMPFFLSLFVFLCGTSWFVFGLLGHDPFVAVPNGFGCGLGAVQLILYAIYQGGSRAESSDEKVEKLKDGTALVEQIVDKRKKQYGQKINITIESLRSPGDGELRKLLRYYQFIFNCKRARLSWAKEGDLNSKYFHSVIKSRRTRNAIRCLKVDGGEFSFDPCVIKSQLVKYFDDSFNGSFSGTPIDPKFLTAGPSVKAEDCSALVRAVSFNEITVLQSRWA